MRNFFEWYDFFSCTACLHHDGRRFFPESSATAGLLVTLAILGVSFMAGKRMTLREHLPLELGLYRPRERR
ncbi:hypothetical protein SIM91_04040 [Rhodococcus opacus]|nr:hypothetical protein [Rhodococcus opacus]MDX5962511.1 hypothetical protein [Rhodococcus opacus]